jgi:hypothetical protein
MRANLILDKLIRQSMRQRNAYVVFVFCLIFTSLHAQTENPAPVKKDPFAFYAGIGPNIYFNNLVLAKDDVNEFNYSIAGRIMWEPEHLLSLGVESGYYRLYTVNIPELPDVKISNSAIPIQVVISMKILKKFYCNFSSGQTILINKVHTPAAGDVNASTLSLGDFAGTFGYKYPLKNHFSLQAELKYFHASKLNDSNAALIFLAGYSF